MAERNNDHTLREQKNIKPNIEDVIPYYLDDENKKNALEFVSYLRENKIKPVWATQNNWKATYKGKIIYYLRLPTTKHHFLNKKKTDENDWLRSWVVTPYVLHYHEYADLIINEGLQDFFWNNMRFCINVLTGECNSHGCAPGIDMNVLGKDFKNLCHFVKSGANTMWVVNPDETEINSIKKLLDFEKQARL